tara:strand:- start:5786 stop:6703 length:918 start_codon:yes stop_codon:yes gene_type:complete
MILNRNLIIEKRFFRNKNILITGASGFIGKNLLEYLSQFECKVIAVYKKTKINLKKKNIKIVKCDLHKPLPKTLKKNKIDLIFHFAGPSADRKSMLIKSKILKSLVIDKNIINFALNHNIPDFFFASSAGVYDIATTNFQEKKLPINNNCDGSYGMCKLITEELLYNSFKKENLTICRFFSVYGKSSNTIINKWKYGIKKNKKIFVWGKGETIRSWLHINDVISGIIKMIIHRKKNIFYNLGSNEKLSLNKTFTIIKKKFPGSKSCIVYNAKINSGPKIRYTNSNNLKKIGWKQKIKLNEGINLI